MRVHARDTIEPDKIQRATVFSRRASIAAFRQRRVLPNSVWGDSTQPLKSFACCNFGNRHKAALSYMSPCVHVESIDVFNHEQ